MELTVDVVGRGSSFGRTPDELIPSREAKLHCILNYFCRVMSKMPEGKLTFHRRVVDTDISWLEAALPVLPVHTVPKGYIEEAAQCVQADFAASGVGGGVLTNGSLMVRLFHLKQRDAFVGEMCSGWPRRRFGLCSARSSSHLGSSLSSSRKTKF